MGVGEQMGILSQAGKLMFQAIFNWHRMIFPWAVFLFQFYNSCLYLFKFSPSVSCSFTLNSSAELFCQRNRFQHTSDVLLQNQGLSGKPGQGGLWEAYGNAGGADFTTPSIEIQLFFIVLSVCLRQSVDLQSYSPGRHALIFLLCWLLSVCLLICVTLKHRNKSPQKETVSQITLLSCLGFLFL